MTDTVATVAGKDAEDRVAVASNWRLVWWRFRRHHLAMASAGLLIFLYMIVLVPDFFSTQDPERTDARQAFIPVQMVHFFDDGRLSPWVPAIVGSPFARRGFIDHAQYETVSILKLIEKRYGLAPLSARDANPAVSDLTSALKLDRNDD